MKLVFSNRGNTQLMTEIGNTVCTVAEVTPGGVLLFFSSYGVLNQMVSFWKKTGIYEKINTIK